MNSSEKLFFEILQAGLWGKEVQTASTREELGRVVKISFSQAVLSIVGDVIISKPALSNLLNEQEYMFIRKFVMSNMSTSRTWNITIQRLVSEMRQHGVEPILLKGQGIAQYYPNPNLRQCGDIDIYVGTEQYETACSVLLKMISDSDKHTIKDIPKHFHAYLGKVPVEVHKYTDVYYPKCYDKKYQRISDEGMAMPAVTIDFAGFSVLTPSVDFNVFYIFNHLWHHFIADGVGLRQICDLAMLLHATHDQINKDYLRKSLEKLGLMKQWKVFGHIVVDKLGLPEEEYPFYDRKHLKLAEKVFRLVMLEGNFGHENLKNHNRPKGYIRGKLYALTSRAKRNMRVLFLFPIDSFRHMYKIISIGIEAVVLDVFRKKR